MWKYYAILSAVFAALTAVLAKIGIRDISGNIATAIRTIVILLIAWGIVAATGELKGVKELTRNNWIFLILSGVATGLSWIFYFKALETLEVSKVASIDNLSIAITIGLSFLILKEPMDWKILLGGLLIVVGMVIIVI